MSDVYLWETYDKLGREALDSGDLVQASEAFRSAVATAEEIQSHDRLVLSLRNLAATMMDMNQVSNAHELLERTLDVANHNLTPDHSQTVETQRDLAHVCRQLGYLDKADEMLKRVLEQELKLQETERVTSTLLALAQVAQARQEPTVSAAYLQRVVKLKRQKLGDDHPEVAQALLWLSTALYQCGKPDDAERFMKKAFGLMERQFADEPSHLAQSLLAGAKMMVDAGQLEPALVHQKRALDIYSSTLEPTDDKLWETREYIATTLAAMGKLEEAIEILEYCFRNGDPQGARAGATYKNLAGLYLALGQSSKAEELYEKASDVLEATLGQEHPAYLATQEERIQLYHFSGRTRLALDVALKTIKATEKRFGAGHPNTAQAYASTALLAHGVEDWQTALELMQAAEKIWTSLSPRPEDVLTNCRTNLATCLIKLERYDEAEAVLQVAETSAGQTLAPTLKELRRELEAGKSQVGEPASESEKSLTVLDTEPSEPQIVNQSPLPSDPPPVSEAPVPPLSTASNDLEEEPTVSESASSAEEEDDLYGSGIDLFDADADDDDDDDSELRFSDDTEDELATQARLEPAGMEEPETSDLFGSDEEDPQAMAEEDDTQEEPEASDLFGSDEEAPQATAEEEATEEEPETSDLFGSDEEAAQAMAEEEATEEEPETSDLFDSDEEEPDSVDLFASDEGEVPDAPVVVEEADEQLRAAEESLDEEHTDSLLVDAHVPETEAREAAVPDSEPTELQAAEEASEKTEVSALSSDEGETEGSEETAEAVSSDQPEDTDDFEASVETEASDKTESTEESDETISVEVPSQHSTFEESSETMLRDTTHEEFQERRAHPRSPLSFNRFFDVKVSVEDEFTEELKSYLVDLGLGGIRINSAEPFPKETDITLTLPDEVLGEEVEVRAEVVWQKALYGASFIQGLAFKDLTSGHKDLIKKQLQPDASARINSRQHFRLYRPFPIKLQAAGQDEWQASYATDLSVNGLGTRLKAPLEQGNPIRLRLELEFELPTVEVEAKVAWSRSGENGVSHGLQFGSVGPVEARTIKRYIDRCLEFLPD